ncbi:MAG: cupin domain-containing protein [Caldilineaceae bacterium]
MPLCDLTSRARKELAPGVQTQTFWSENLLLSRVELAPHATVPAHSHVHEQALVLLSGSLDLFIEGMVCHLSAGALYLIPANVEHEVRVGTVGCVVLDVFSPVRESLQY